MRGEGCGMIGQSRKEIEHQGGVRAEGKKVGERQGRGREQICMWCNSNDMYTPEERALMAFNGTKKALSAWSHRPERRQNGCTKTQMNEHCIRRKVAQLRTSLLNTHDRSRKESE